MGATFESRTPARRDGRGLARHARHVRLKDRAWAQLGTSGSGNHFVEFGKLTVLDDAVGPRARHVPRAAQPLRQPRHGRADRAALQPARARAPSRSCRRSLSTWRGSIFDRGGSGVLGRDGADGPVCRRQSRADSQARRAGARRRRACSTSRTITTSRGANGTAPRWHGGRGIVHRKGATPAGVGVLGIIPGSMGTPGYVVRGKGVAASLNSAAHGAGRRMSRTKAKELFTWDDVQDSCASAASRCSRPVSTRRRWPTRTSTR